MKIGIIGIGAFSLNAGYLSAQKGHEVLVHHPRGNSLLKGLFSNDNNNVKPVSLQEAAGAEIILLHAGREEIETLISTMPDMSGKTILLTGGIIFNPDAPQPGLFKSSSYALTASLLPYARTANLYLPVDFEKCVEGSAKSDHRLFFFADPYDSPKIRKFLKSIDFTPVHLPDAAFQRKKDGPVLPGEA